MIPLSRINNQAAVEIVLRDILKADIAGVKKMRHKASFYNIFVQGLSCYEANILKQEILSIGGECAIPRSAILNKGNADALIMATARQLLGLIEKLGQQPFGNMVVLKKELKALLSEKSCADIWRCRGKSIKLNKPLVMGILNVTPDSFSKDGLDKNIPAVVRRAREMKRAGALILDIGGESSRPGARPVSEKEEMKRVVPAIEAVKKSVKGVIISVDTRRPNVALAAIESGADIVNDITGLKNKKMRGLCAKYGAGVVIMHIQGMPESMQNNPSYKNVVADIYSFFKKRVKLLLRDGISEDSIVIDPGIGFGKTVRHNYILLKGLSVFSLLGRPVLVGVSRKSFIGAIDGSDVGKRIGGTIAANLWAMENGAKILRVHDVFEISQAIKVWESIRDIS